MSQLVYFGFPQ
jgi:hypothetical protein